MDVRGYVLCLLQKKYSLDPSVDIDSFNYVESGYVDSMGLLQFIVEIEDEFSVEFTDEEMVSSEFKTIGGLINIIESKMRDIHEKP